MRSKIILLMVVVFLLSVFMVGCDESYSSVGKTAIVSLPNGEIVEGEVQSIRRLSEGYLLVVIDGASYEVHSMNIAVVGGNENAE